MVRELQERLDQVLLHLGALEDLVQRVEERARKRVEPGGEARPRVHEPPLYAWVRVAETQE